MLALKKFANRIPFVGARKAHKPQKQKTFPGSRTYWEERYANGRNSGVGSFGKFAEFKAEVLNTFVRKNRIDSVIEFGCGDGNQLQLAEYAHYIGYDVSKTAIARCRELFDGDATKSFCLLDDYTGQTADLTLSLDVIYHLIEDAVYEAYMRRLFDSARRYVLIYSSDTDEEHKAKHVKHRNFTAWIRDNAKNWSLKQHIPNKYPYEGDYTRGSFSEFYIYERKQFQDQITV